MNNQLFHLIKFLPWLAWCLGLGVLSLIPSPPSPDIAFLSWDKFQHAGAYALFTLLAGYACLPHFRFTVAWLLAFSSAVLYGGVMEIAQGVLTNVRAPEWGDLVADAVGAALVLIIALLLRTQPAGYR